MGKKYNAQRNLQYSESQRNKKVTVTNPVTNNTEKITEEDYFGIPDTGGEPNQSAETTSFNNDSTYNFISKDFSQFGSEESKKNTFTTLSNKTKTFNPARNNTFLTTVDVWSGSTYINVVPSEYIKTCKAPLVEITENGEVPMGLYNIDLTTISKSGKTLSIEVHEDDDRSILKNILAGINNYQSVDNQASGVYKSIKKSFWKVHHKIFNYKGELILTGHYIVTPKLNMDDTMGYESIGVVNYILDFKVVNYHIYDAEGNKLI